MTLLSLFLAGVSLFGIAILAPLLFLRSANGTSRFISIFSQMVGSAIFIAFAASVLITNDNVRTFAYQFMAGAGISFFIDRLTAFFILIICVLALTSGIYSLQQKEHNPGISANITAAMTAAFVLSMVLTVSSGTTFGFLIFWETMSISSFLLVMRDYKSSIIQKSGLFYFIMTQMSTVFLIFSFLLMQNIIGSFDMFSIDNAPENLRGILFIALFVGFGIKAGIMPFHKWLPYAYSAAPTDISALMSGAMKKVAIYGMLRFIVTAVEPELWHGVLLLFFGSLSALLGVIYALKEPDLKKMLAYSSIENGGIILISFSLFIIFNVYNLDELAALALAGGIFHTLNHSVFKSLLFLTAGSVISRTGTVNIEKMGGLAKKMPVTAVLFLIGAASVSALPPMNGFISELMIFQALSQSFNIGEPLVEIMLFASLALLGLTSALAAACFVKAFGTVFLALPRSEEARNASEAPKSMLIGPAILAVFCAGLGVFSYQLLAAAGAPQVTPDLLTISLVIIGFVVLTVLLVRLTTNGKTRITETWGCGQIRLNSKTEYSGAGFSEPILNIFRPIYRTRKESSKVFADKSKATVSSGTAAINTFKLFEDKVYMPAVNFIQRLSNKVADLQDVDLEDHILYAFVAILILLALAWWAL